jgi:hypothetical protein
MTRSESPQIQVGTARGSEPTAASNLYIMSREGRRQAVILLLGVATLWVAALWIALTILLDGVGGVEWVSLLLMLGIIVVAPLAGWALVEELTSRITTDAHGINYRAAGGINLCYSWKALTGFRPRQDPGRVKRFFLGDAPVDVHDDGRDRDRHVHTPDDGPAAEAEGAVAPDSTHPLQDEQGTLLLQTSVDPAAQITNPLVRFLHRLAYGTAIPLYGGLEGRDELVKEIAAHLQPANPEGAC